MFKLFIILVIPKLTTYFPTISSTFTEENNIENFNRSSLSAYEIPHLSIIEYVIEGCDLHLYGIDAIGDNPKYSLKEMIEMPRMINGIEGFKISVLSCNKSTLFLFDNNIIKFVLKLQQKLRNSDFIYKKILTLKHPNIVETYKIFHMERQFGRNIITDAEVIHNRKVFKNTNKIDNEYSWIFMEYLDVLVVYNDRRNIKKIRDITFDILRGIYYLHELNIIHSLINHENIRGMRGEMGNIYKLINLHSMVVLNKNEEKRICFRENTFYNAPEVIMNGILSLKADVYSYGVFLNYLITGFVKEIESLNNDISRGCKRCVNNINTQIIQPLCIECENADLCNKCKMCNHCHDCPNCAVCNRCKNCKNCTFCYSCRLVKRKFFLIAKYSISIAQNVTTNDENLRGLINMCHRKFHERYTTKELVSKTNTLIVFEVPYLCNKYKPGPHFPGVFPDDEKVYNWCFL